MAIRGISRALILILALGLLLSLGTGCTKYASQDDLKLLEETKEAALAAERKLDGLEKEMPSHQQAKAKKESELAEVQAEKARVEDCVEKQKAQAEEPQVEEVEQ